MSTPDFHLLERQLADSRALTDLPEAHGTLAGALCSADELSLRDWLREIFPEGSAGEAEGALHAVFEWTRHVLRSGQLEFHLLLPDDDTPVAARATALGQWCQGFLYGLGSHPLPEVEQLPQEIAEIVQDLTAMTRVEVDETEPLEDNEQAYAELVEFVRIGVQLLHDELARFRERSAPPAAAGGAMTDGDDIEDRDDGPLSIH